MLMVTNTPKTGTKYRLRNDFGYGPGMLPAGAEGVVTAVHGPDHFRPGEVDQDVVFIDVDDPAQSAPRTLSLTVDRFEEHFEPKPKRGGARAR